MILQGRQNLRWALSFQTSLRVNSGVGADWMESVFWFRMKKNSKRCFIFHACNLPYLIFLLNFSFFSTLVLVSCEGYIYFFSCWNLMLDEICVFYSLLFRWWWLFFCLFVLDALSDTVRECFVTFRQLSISKQFTKLQFDLVEQMSLVFFPWRYLCRIEIF